MSVLIEALEQFTVWLELHHSNLVASLRPGLTLEEINSLSQQLPVQLSEEIQELYQWSNGCHLFMSPYYWDDALIFFRLEQAIQCTEDVGDLSENLNIPGFFMFPEFERWVHFAVCNGDKTSPVLVITDDPYIRLAYASITSMVLTTLECCEKGVFHVGKYGSMVLNKRLIDEFKAIRHKHNSMFNQESLRQKYNITIS